MFDKNGDGCISTSDLKGVMKSLHVKCSEDELAYIVGLLDTTGSGLISKYEFKKFVESKSEPKEQDEVMMAAFKQFDRLDRGRISIHQIKLGLANMGEKLSYDEIAVLVSQ